MIHWAEPGHQALCSAAGETSYDETAVTCGECLYHLITGALENDPAPQGSLYALELCEILARVSNPGLSIKVTVTAA